MFSVCSILAIVAVIFYSILLCFLSSPSWSFYIHGFDPVDEVEVENIRGNLLGAMAMWVATGVFFYVKGHYFDVPVSVGQSKKEILAEDFGASFNPMQSKDDPKLRGFVNLQDKDSGAPARGSAPGSGSAPGRSPGLDSSPRAYNPNDSGVQMTSL